MDYHGSHRPMADGDPLHDLASQGTFPPDVYTHPEYYIFGEHGAVSAAVTRLVRGRPDALVTIYRAVPDGITEINPGDWVCLEEGYARQHAIQTEDPADDWPVISARVPAHVLRSGGSDLLEWGYFGPTVEATPVSA